MTNVLLSGLLAGTLALGAPTGDDPAASARVAPSDSADVAVTAVAPAGRSVFAQVAPERSEEAVTPRTSTQDTYAFGVPSDLSPIKLWAHYAYGTAEDIWNTRGEDDENADPARDGALRVAGTRGKIVSQRAVFGGQLNVLNFAAFKLGAGAQVVLAKNAFEVDTDRAASAFTNPIGDIESDFGAQNVKVFGAARGRVVGVHGGYIFDLGSDREFGTTQATVNAGPLGANAPVSINANGTIAPTALVGTSGTFQPLLLPTKLSNSDGRDAIFFGADFDVPSERFRVFGGIDYYMLQQSEDNPDTAFNDAEVDNDDYLNFLFGLGIKASVFEVGAALQIQTRFDNPTVADVGTVRGIGGHAGTVSPYVRISPPNIPVSIFAKGAVLEEYTDFGYAIGGSNSVKPKIGGTVGLTVGFN